ncbi:MAG: hypothetical protein IT318_24530 [Anaerolineales bacterium]|nr:hypothetical protein [Anaerolineales bacterium]
MARSGTLKQAARLVRLVALVALLVPQAGWAAPTTAPTLAVAHRRTGIFQAAGQPQLDSSSPRVEGTPATPPTEEGLPTATALPSPTPRSASVMFVENAGQVAGGVDPGGQGQPRFQVEGLGSAVYLAPDAIWITQLDLRVPGNTPLAPEPTATLETTDAAVASPAPGEQGAGTEPTQALETPPGSDSPTTETPPLEATATNTPAEPLATLSAGDLPIPGETATGEAAASPTSPATETALPSTSPTPVSPSATPSPSATSSATLNPPTSTATEPPTATATPDQPTATPIGLPGDPPRPVGFNNLRVSFAGANPAPALAGTDRLDTQVSYFQGSDPGAWQADVPVWAGVRYTALYPGLDLVIGSEQGQWAWRLVVTDPAQGLPQLANVAWQVAGADRLTLDQNGLHLHSPAGETTLPLLRVVTAAGAELSAADLQAAGVSGPSQQADRLAQPFLALAQTAQVGARVPGLMAVVPGGAYQPLFDPNPPSNIFSTYLGGEAFAAALALDGAAYASGFTWVADFTYTVGYSQTQSPDSDVFIIKMTANGDGLYYLSHIGGDGFEYAKAMAVDGNGAAYVTGISFSSDYPTTAGAYDSVSDTWNPIVTKLGPDGTTLDYSTYLATGIGEGIAVRPFVNDVVYVVGITNDLAFPTTPDGYATAPIGNADVFLAVIDTTQTGDDAIVYGSYLGGTWDDCSNDLWHGCSVAVDRYGYIYVAGAAWSIDIPMPDNAYALEADEGGDGFLLKLDPTISGTASLLYGTYLGGSGYDCINGCTVAVNGNQSAYIAGATNSTDLPTTSGVYSDTYAGGDTDVFALRFDTTLSGTASLGYSTYLGGSDVETALGLAVNAAGEVTLVGQVFSSDFPVTADAFQDTYAGSRDGFVARLSPDASQLLYGSFYGGDNDDFAWNVAVRPYDNTQVLVVGRSETGDLPISEGVYYPIRYGGYYGWMAKFILVTCAR